jgi:hypothetical protein
MSEGLIAILFVVVGMPAVLFLISMINYRVDDRYVRIYWGALPVRKLAIEDIREATRGYRHMSESWTNTIWMPTIRSRGVTLHRRTGGLRHVIITPDDPDRFIAEIKSHRHFRGGTAG